MNIKQYYINGQNLFDRYKIVVEKGAFDELLKEPERKNEYSHNWLDQNGTERFVNTTFETRVLELNFVFVCDTLEEYIQNKKDFYDLLKGGYFEFASVELGLKWQLLYKGNSSIDNITPIRRGQQMVSVHTVTLYDDNTVSEYFEAVAYLTDENGVVLTDENDNILTVDL